MAAFDKERNKKKKNKTDLIIGIVVLLIWTYLYFSAYTYKQTDLRMGWLEAFSNGGLYLLTHPASIIKIHSDSITMYLLITAAMLLAFFMNKLTRDMKKSDDPNTVKGESRFMTMQDYLAFNARRNYPYKKTTVDKTKNMIISQDIFLGLHGFKTRRNCNMIIFGGSGAGKSRFFAGPNILQLNSNFIITDPSGELVRDYGKILEDNGYEVKVFNTTDMYGGSRYNPFHYIKEEKDIFILVNTLIKNTKSPDAKGGDEFWENGEKLLLTALCLFLWHTRPEKDQTFAKVMELVNLADVDEDNPSAQSPLDKLFEDFEREDPDNLAVSNYKTFKKAAGKTLKSFIISVGTRLYQFKLDDVKYVTSEDTLQLESFGDSKQALFVITPTADTTFNFLVSLLYSQLFSTLYTYCETTASYGYLIRLDDENVLRTFRANSRTESETAKANAETFLKKIKAGVKVKYNKEKQLYYIMTKGADSEVITWRGTKAGVKQFIQNISALTVEKCMEMCPNHVRFILDEFANIGQIPDFSQKVATIRKYSISVSIILQSVSQLKEIYEKQWNTIIGNCDTLLFLGSRDKETITLVQDEMGERTAIVRNTSYQEKGHGSESFNRDAQKLMSLSTIARMDDSECLVLIRGEYPYHGKKYDIEAHPNYEYAKKTKGLFKIGSISDKEREMMRQRKLPFRLRGDNASKQAEEINDALPNNPIEPSTPQPKPQEKNSDDTQRKVENAARKEVADEALEALNEVDFNDVTQIMDAFGVNENDDDETIKERVLTTLENLETDIDISEIVYTTI